MRWDPNPLHMREQWWALVAKKVVKLNYFSTKLFLISSTKLK